MKTLQGFYEIINNHLKGTGIYNSDVQISIQIDGQEVEVEKSEFIKIPLSAEEQKHASGMYPPRHTAKLILHLKKKS